MGRTAIAVVHAKGHSERLAGKNLRVLGDKPLFCHILESALKAKNVSLVVIDSDSDEILDIGMHLGAYPLKRPESLATNATSGDDLIKWQLTALPTADVIVQTVPTSPFIRPATIEFAVELTEEYYSVVGCRNELLYKWEDGVPAYYYHSDRLLNSYELEPTLYETTGLYATTADSIRSCGKRVNDESCFAIILGRIEAINIDSESDFKFAELVWRGMRC